MAGALGRAQGLKAVQNLNQNIPIQPGNALNQLNNPMNIVNAQQGNGMFPPQNNGMFPPRPQYVPPASPKPGLEHIVPPHQISPPTKSQLKILMAKYPEARQIWEAWKNGTFGSPEQFLQFSQLTPQQRSIMEYLGNLGTYNLQYPNADFAPIAQQAQNQFYQQTVPSLAERFTSMSGGALSSPSFASQLGQAGAGLQSDLASQQAQWNQQNTQQALGMLQLGLNPFAENIHRPAQQGFAPKAIEQFIKMIPSLIAG